MIGGRGFSGGDSEPGPIELVVNEAMAKLVWPGRDPLGQCVRLQKRDGPCYTVVGVDAYPGHVAREGSGTLDDVAAHLEHVVSLVGVRHAALGADFAGFDGPTVAGMEDASCYPRLAAHLRGRGWREEDLEAVWWRNWHRVLSERPV